MSRKTALSSSLFNLKGYVKSATRHEAARLYLAIKLNNHDENLIDKLTIRMGKVKALRNRILTFCNNALVSNNEATEQLKDNADIEPIIIEGAIIAEVYAEEAGLNDNNDTAANPYEQGVTGGFSLHGVGQGYLRYALKGCPHCQGLLRHRSNTINHAPNCEYADAEDFEAAWFENPRLTEQDGRYEQLSNGTSILTTISQEEDSMLGDRQTNGSTCEHEDHIEVKVQVIGSDGEPTSDTRIRYMREAMRKGEIVLVACWDCNGTNIKYPTCRMCNGEQVINYTHTTSAAVFNPELGVEETAYGEKVIDSHPCPMCFHTNGRTINVTGSSNDANRELQANLLQQARMDAKWVNIGDDFVDFVTNVTNVAWATNLRNKNNRKHDLKVALVEKYKTQGLTKDEQELLNELNNIERWTDLDAWQAIITASIELGDLDLELIHVKDGKVLASTNGSVLAALERILNWCLNPSSVAVAGSIGRKYEEVTMLLPENLHVGDPWGPYLLERELGDAELMEHDPSIHYTSAFDVYPLNEPVQVDVRMDDINGYNPGRDLSERAAQAAQVDTIVDIVLPVITNPKATFVDYFNAIQSLKDFRRPRKLTVGEFLGNNPQFLNQPKSMAFMDEPMFRAKTGKGDNVKQVAGFLMGDTFVQLKQEVDIDQLAEAMEYATNRWPKDERKQKEYIRNRKRTMPKYWTSTLHKNVHTIDGISCWKTANISEEGANNALALMAVVMLKRRNIRDSISKRKFSGADALIDMGKPELADIYKAMTICYQWLPPEFKMDRLPELAYFKWESAGLMSREWDTVPSRVTQGAINSWTKDWCFDNNVRWTSIKDTSTRYPKYFVMPENKSDFAAWEKAKDAWLDKMAQQRIEALTQFKDRMDNMAERWKPVITEWLNNRKAAHALLNEWGSEGKSMTTHDDFDIMVGNVPDGPRVYGGTNVHLQFRNVEDKASKSKLTQEQLGQMVGEVIATIISKTEGPIELPTCCWTKVNYAEPGSIIKPPVMLS